MVTYSSILAWESPWTEEPGGLQSMGSQKVREDLATKESACNAGDPSLIPGLGRSTGEEIGYSLQYSWTSLLAQTVKNPSAMLQTWIWSLGLKDPLEKGTATHSSILAWRIPWTEEPGRPQSIGCKELDMTEHYHAFTHSTVYTLTTAIKHLRGDTSHLSINRIRN